MTDIKFAPLVAMREPKGRRPVPANCTVDELCIDPDYQRGIERQSIALIRAIAQDWDWTLCQPLIIARRPDDSLWVVDGQHRLLAARLRGDIRDLPCIVVHYGSIEAEAQGFVALNTKRRPLTPYALWRAALTSGDSQALDLQAMLMRHGLHIASGADYKNWKAGGLNNVAAIQSLYRQDSARLERILAIISAAFDGQVLQYGATFIAAIKRLLTIATVNDQALIDLLRTRTQAKWLSRFDAFAVDNGCSVVVAAPEVFRRALFGVPDGPVGGGHPRKTSRSTSAGSGGLAVPTADTRRKDGTRCGRRWHSRSAAHSKTRSIDDAGRRRIGDVLK